jgi:hypothetical protein
MVCILAGDNGSFIPFELRPFPGTPPLEGRVIGRLARKGTDLLCRFEVTGLGDLEIPAPAPQPERRDGLWRETCLELFLGCPGRAEYWEVNLSPAGHWNVYRFDDYRQGMAEEGKLTFLPFLVLPEAERLTLDVALDLSVLGLEKEELAVGTAAVLRARSGEVAYHALTHPRADPAAGGRPDFHHREGWSLRLPAVGN